MRIFILFLLLSGFLTACGVNPVTGKSEISLVGGAQEIEMGEQNYAPMQQSQGGIYDVDPALLEYVQGVGGRLAAVSDRELPYEFMVLNNSVPNAWALPGGKIAINRGLLTELESESELAAVLGHEVVHAAARHSAKRMERGQFMQGLIIATAVLTPSNSFGNYAVGSASVAAQLINQKYGRGDELESDKYGMKYMSLAGYDPQGAVALQQTFVRLSEGQDADWLTGLFASHPPSRERVDENRKTAQSLPSGGETGEAEFRAAMATTLAAKPAYDLYDEGRVALAEDDADLALEKAEQAIDKFPDEANFYALRGDVRLSRDEFDQAIINYNSAIQRRSDYFEYYLRRGQANEGLGRLGPARADLEKSNSFLPTALAYYYLGNVEVASGNIEEAIAHYKKVAGTEGEVAQAAKIELVKLDIANNPGDYILHRCDPDNQGNLVVAVKNNTPVTLGDITFSVQYRDNYGQPRQVNQRVPGQLDGGQVTSVATGLGPYNAGSDCPVVITGASVSE